MNLGDNVIGFVSVHYPGMTEKSLSCDPDQAEARLAYPEDASDSPRGWPRYRWPDCLRYVSSAHRGAARSVRVSVMDFLKTKAPFWKKERTTETTAGLILAIQMSKLRIAGRNNSRNMMLLQKFTLLIETVKSRLLRSAFLWMLQSHLSNNLRINKWLITQVAYKFGVILSVLGAVHYAVFVYKSDNPHK